MIRLPAVAGRFYPEDPEQLDHLVASLFAAANQSTKSSARACVVPHAGYKYSGRTAAETYARIDIPNRVILLGPRHYPRGAPLAILSHDPWQTPFGLAPIDQELASKLQRACSLLREDEVAHSAEHSLEVQLPFLQRLVPAFSFVPIVIGPLRFEELEVLGRAIAEVVSSETGPILIVASSDMNHYEADDVTRVKDRKAIDRILALEPRELFNVVRNESISMCGYGAVVATLTAVRELRAVHAELVSYATSGEINGDFREVVGYAGIVIG
jgi:MEMO1 family protein